MTTTPPHPQKAITFAALYDTYSPSLFALLFKLVGHQERAEDLLHDSFIKIWAHFHRYDPEQGGLYNWVTTIARNVAMDELRHRKVQREASMYMYDQSGDDVYAIVREQLSNEHIYTLLPTQYGQILELVYTHGLTQVEIAQEMGLPLGTVKTRCRVGLQKLQYIFSHDIRQYRMI